MKKLFFFIILLFLVALASLMWRSATTEAAWFDPVDVETEWSYRVPITVASTSVPANQTDFSLILDLSLLPAGFHTNVKEDGSDIRVTTSDGSTEVPRDVISYSTSTDTGIMRFKGDISSTTDTTFYVYYGNSSATEPVASSTYGRYNAYDEYWKLYYPLQSNILNRTQYNLTLTNTGSATIGGIAGKFGRATNLNGSTQYLNSAASSTLATLPFTMVIWASSSPATSTTTRDAFSFGDPDNYRDYSLMTYDNGVDLEYGASTFSSGGTIYSNASEYPMTMGTFGQIVGVNIGSESRYVYVNGERGNESTAPSLVPSNKRVVIGASSRVVSNKFLGGVQDAQLHTTQRSTAWIKTEYNQTNDNDAFWTVGTGEDNPAGVTPKVAVKGTLRVKSDQNLRIRF